MKILVFGVLQDVVGKSEFEMEAGSDLDSFRKDLLQAYPLLKNYQFQIAVNKEKVESNPGLIESDEIALLPPYAGG